MEQKRIAVIGAGAVGQLHIDKIKAEPRCVLHAVVDPTEAAANLAAQYGAAYFPSCAAMLDRSPPDGVVISTPNHLHTQIAVACLSRGIPALIEKPVAESLAAARTIAAAVDAHGVPVLIGHQRRHNPIMGKARDLLREGRIGKPVVVFANWLRRKADAYFSIAWKTQSGGGPILINAIHEIDCLRMLCGEIEAVAAATSNAARNLEVEDTFVASLRFANGMVGTLAVSDATPTPANWELLAGEDRRYPQRSGDMMMVCGTEGALGVPSLSLWRNQGPGGRSDPMIEEKGFAPWEDAYQRQLLHFLDMIAGEAEPVCSARDATKTLAVAVAIAEAGETGRWVEIG